MAKWLNPKLNRITDEEKIATERIKEIDLVLRMVEVGFNGKKVYYKIDKAKVKIKQLITKHALILN